MNDAAKLLAFGAAVAASFGGALAVGAAVGPLEVGRADAEVGEHPAVSSIPDPSTVAAVDGYVVELRGTPRAGASELAFVVEREGEPVTTEPYFEAAGHLVAIRAGDLAYLHVHPSDVAAPPAIGFVVEFPTAATYRLFLDFSHDGVVHTAAFTVVVPDPSTDPGDPHESGH